MQDRFARTLPAVPGINAQPMGLRQPIGHTPWRVARNTRIKRMQAAAVVKPTGGRVADRGNPGNPKPRRTRTKSTPNSALHAMWAKGTLEF